MRIGPFEVIGLLGIGLVIVGGLLSVVVPQVGLGVTTFGLGVPLLGIGGVVLWVGIIGAWIQGIARATRAWDEVRKDYTAPPK